MDPQSILIGLVVCVLSAIIIYLITAFTMKEKTFDEVLEEQRRRQEEEKPKSKKKTVDVAKKKIKKEPTKDKSKTKVEQPKKEKEKEPKMVNLEIEPEVIDSEENLAVHAKKSKKTKSQKPILVNKNEQPLVAETTKEVYHKEIAPRDEVALKHKHNDEKTAKIEDQGKSKKKSSEHKKEKTSKMEIDTEIQASVEKVLKSERKSEANKENKEKSKGKSLDKNKSLPESGTSSMPLINSVKNASLNDNDIQSLIDVLLNKQGGSIDVNADWNKKSQKGQKTDSLSLLKQQLEEKERALQQEQQIAMSSNNKVKEIRQDLNTEKAKYISLEKAYKEKLESQNMEMGALQSRIAHTHEQHAAEINNLQARLRQFEQSNDRNLLQKLSEENKILQDTLSNLTKTKSESISPAELNSIRQKAAIMDKELTNNAIKLNASESTRKMLEGKIAKYEEQLRHFETDQKDTEAVLIKKLEEVNKELRRADTKNSTLNNDFKKATGDLQKANNAFKSAESECVALKKQLQELKNHLASGDVTKELEGKLQQANRKSSELEGNVKNLEKQLSDSNRRYSEIKNEIEVLKHENLALAEEMKTTKERQSGEGQEAVPNAPSGAPNGDIHQETKNKNVINLVEHESILSEKIKELTRLSSELANQKSEVGTLREQLENQKKKNNELREKNWKAMEALEKTEKSVSEKVQNAVKTTREKNESLSRDVEALDKGVLQRLFPSISVSEKLVHKEWISSFEKQANTYVTNLSQKSSNSANQDSKISQLEDTNKKLSSQTRDLQKIIDDTENKLKQLQKSVETEEKKWKDKLEKALSSSKSPASNSQVEELELQVIEYRNVLASTESRLLQLSEKVESEEKLWQGKLQASKTEVETAQKELSNVKEELKKSKGSTEMEIKVEVLEKELRHADEEKIQLHDEIEEAKSQVIILEKQIETSSQISVENEEYRRLYEAEKKKVKELSTNLVKLNGIIKTGQDALSQEQKLVKQLQEQFDTSNGSVGSQAISSAASPSKDNGTSV